MHIGFLPPFHLPDAQSVPVVFHLRELRLRLEARGHQVSSPSPPSALPADWFTLYKGLILQLIRGGVDVIHDASGLELPPSAVPRVDLRGATAAELGAVALEQWSHHVECQTKRLVWLGCVRPESGVRIALQTAAQVERPLLMAGPIADALWFDAMVRPKLGAHAWHIGPIDRRDTADLLACSAVLIHTDTSEQPMHPAVHMSLAAATPVAAIRTAALEVEFAPDCVRLASNAATLPSAVLEAATLIRANCLATAQRRFAPHNHVEVWLSRYRQAIDQSSGSASR